VNYGTARKLLKIWLMKRLRVAATMTDGGLYGQGLDDGYLLRIFGARRTGTFVDVGANDGVFVSNTFTLYRLGWRGICIEPHPDAFAKLRVNRPLDLCVRCAAGSAAREVELVWDGDISEGARVGVSGSAGASVRVASRRLTEILDEAKFPAELDLLSVDVEGYELDVLRSLDWTRFRPRVVIVEYNTGGLANYAAIDFLGALGYRPVVITRWNCILSRNWADDVIAAHRSQAWFKSA
jgi:FkbM family methyltransferase